MKLQFIKEVVRNFFTIGAVLPSSRWSVAAVVREIPENCMNVAEYGPGTGIVTTEILKRLGKNGNLWAIELNREFAKVLRGISDSRLHVIQGNVVEEAAALRNKVPTGMDAVVSGIPFSFIPEDSREKLLHATRQALHDGGRFIVYQHTLKMLRPLKRHFRSVRIGFEPRNFPPYFVMVASA